MSNNKLKIYPYQKSFPVRFEKFKKALIEALPASAEIHHIGSTAVPGLGGKGIIDMMIALPNWRQEKEIISNLQKIGYKHLHPRQRGRIFMSLVGETKKGDPHLHLVLKKSVNYQELLRFRNCLRQNQKLLKEYQLIKNILVQDPKQNRVSYGQIKARFIKKNSRVGLPVSRFRNRLIKTLKNET